MSDSVLRIESLSKTYPGTRALCDVSLEIRSQEIHALVGQNGSGKSTLIKTLAGYHRADPGARVWLHGDPFDPSDLSDERHERLRFVHQELGLFLELGAADNLALLGQFHRHRPIGWIPGRIHWAAQRRATRAALAQFGADVDVDAPLSQASPVERTVVAISAALQGWEGGSGVLVLDEPTAVLPAHEVSRLLAVVREVRRRGTSVLYVSHRLDELFGLADRVSVLRGGYLVATRDIADLDREKLATLMVGAAIDIDYRAPHRSRSDESVVCELRDVSGPELRGVSFTIRRGEVLGVAGLPGSGVRELPYALAGAVKHGASGWIRAPQRSPEWLSIADAASLRIPIVPADRRTESVIAPFTVGENMTLRTLDRLRRGIVRSSELERASIADWSRRMQVEPPGSAPLPISELSGGNQQKVVLARCLALEPEILVMCEPTAGVDIRTRRALYELIAAQAAEGLSVVVSSIDIGDLLAMCTRVLVLSRGRIVGSLADESLTEESVLHAMELDEQT